MADVHLLQNRHIDAEHKYLGRAQGGKQRKSTHLNKQPILNSNSSSCNARRIQRRPGHGQYQSSAGWSSIRPAGHSVRIQTSPPSNERRRKPAPWHFHLTCQLADKSSHWHVHSHNILFKTYVMHTHTQANICIHLIIIITNRSPNANRPIIIIILNHKQNIIIKVIISDQQGT
jgi:hypothetical protein